MDRSLTVAVTHRKDAVLKQSRDRQGAVNLTGLLPARRVFVNPR